MRISMGVILSFILLSFAPLTVSAQNHQLQVSELLSADQDFLLLTEEEFAYRQEFGFSSRSSKGWRGAIPDPSEAGFKGREKAYRSYLDRFHAIRLETLSPENQVHAKVYAHQLQSIWAELYFKDYQKPVNSDTAFWSELSSGLQRPIQNETELSAYLAWLESVPTFLSQMRGHMDQGLRRGFAPPFISMQGRDKALVALTLAMGKDSAYFAPLRSYLENLPANEAAVLEAQFVKIINTKIIPAHQELLSFYQGHYLQKAPKSLAALSYPDGKAYYLSKIYEFTTLDLSADAIHQIGLDEVKSIRAEMEETKKKAGFKGDLSAFLQFLRTDPQFYPQTPKDLLYKAAHVSKRVDGKLSQYFGLLPRARFAIVPVPDDIAPYYTAGRGGPSTYWVNTYNLPSRPLYSLPALTLHESAPGHSFQMSLSAENSVLPPFRAQTYISAYGEGWALYTERLGVEMGIYEDAYEHFGMLSYQMWRAARLVVDTGIHTKGWTREQAIGFMKDNTALSDHEIHTEIDRYITWPGQALSYYIGQLEIVRLRKESMQKLGKAFDLKAFHDLILKQGSVPLGVLRDSVSDWQNQVLDSAGKNLQNP